MGKIKYWQYILYTLIIVKLQFSMSLSHINRSINYCDILTAGFDVKIIKPADEYDLKHIKLYIKNTLEY